LKLLDRGYGTEDPQFLRSMSALFGTAFVGGNRIETLLNGDEIFPAMLAAIRSAESSITFETYIYWSGNIGRQFTDALVERAKAGVAVHVLIDWVGSQEMEQAYLDEMAAAGVEIRYYHPLRWYHLERLNNRTHRKLLVIDGRIGFTGGVGISDHWLGNAQDPEHWRDTHYRVEGPVIAQMQSAFLDNWSEVTGKLLHDRAYFPPLAPVGEVRAQLLNSTAGDGFEPAYVMYLLALASAEKSIHLAMAYFILDTECERLLLEALNRGVRVQIIVPGRHMDVPVVRAASRALWGRLLRAGGEIHEYQPTMFHNKILVVDRLWTSVGSTNFDARSFNLNDEANLNVYDRGFAERQIEDFERDLDKSKRISLEQWSRRPLRERIRERLAGLLRSQL
jgi:cardiolipin synthase